MSDTPLHAPGARGSQLPAFSARPVPNRPQHVLELACRVFQAAAGGVGFVTADELAEHLTWGIAEAELPAFRRSGWGAAVARLLIEHGAPLCLPDVADHPRLGPAPFTPAPGPFAGAPLALPGRWLGVLYLVRPAGAPAFSEHDLDVLRCFAAGLEYGDLCEEARLVAQLQLLNRLAQATAGNLELAPILQTALRELARHLPLHTCAVWLTAPEAEDRGSRIAPFDPRSSELGLAQVTAAGRDGTGPLGLAPGMRLRAEETPFRTCLLDGQAVYDDWAPPGGRDSALAEALSREGATASFAVPLRAGDRTLGVLQSVCTRRGGFTAEQIQLLYLVADLLGPAVSNCQLFGRLHTAYEELRVAQGQLVQAEKMRALGELASGMAHEFNNSLCGVLGFLELVLRGPLESSPRRDLEAARSCALGAAKVVRRVQDFACCRPAADLCWVDVNDLLRRTVELARHKWETLAQARRVRIAVDVRAEAGAGVAGDAGELSEALTNLLFNAVDAMPEGGTLTLRAWSTPERVFLAVGDTGTGIPEAVRPRLFEPFFTTKGDRGSGLGLSVTFGIVRRHGGEIAVESQPGGGSTFTLSFPAAPPPPAQTEPAPAQEPAPPAGLRILVVDDEEPIRRFLDAALSRLGHRVRLAPAAGEALLVLARERFDVVLTDLGLPDASGEEVARGAARCCPGTPVIMLTGWAEQIRDDPPEGVAQVLGKPVTLDALARALAAVVQSDRPMGFDNPNR